MDKEKFKEWMAVKKEHLKDYAAPYTEKIQPMVDNIKDRTEPLRDQVKEKAGPMAEKAKEQIAANTEKLKAQAEAKRIEREQKAAEKAAAQAELGDNGCNKGPDKKILIAVGVAIVLIVGLVLMLILRGKDDEVVDPSTNIESTIDVEDTTEPPEETILVDEAKRPTLTINGNEYKFGCELEDLLETMEITNIDTRLHYNPKALIVQPGKTRDWELEDEEGRMVLVTIYNHTDEELSSEKCKVIKVILSKEKFTADVAIVSTQIELGMQAKGIVDVLGSVSGRDEKNEAMAYWWNWHPYQQSDKHISVYVLADHETGEVIYIKAEAPFVME